MNDHADAFGRALMDWERGGRNPEMYERDDGFIEAGDGAHTYLATFRSWPHPERQATHCMRGRVADVGCGAGRVALYLQQRGLEVIGIDSSPLAVRTARRRGVEDVWCMSVDRLTDNIDTFDTIVLFGNNFGIFGTPERLRGTLANWARRVHPGTRLVAESTSPYCGGVPAFDRSYYRRNRQLGRMAGQVTLRVRYREWATPWFEWLFVSRHEMRSLLRGTGWKHLRTLGDDPGEPYVGVWEKR